MSVRVCVCVCVLLVVVIWFWYGIFGLNNRETNLIECDDMAHSLRIMYRMYKIHIYMQSQWRHSKHIIVVTILKTDSTWITHTQTHKGDDNLLTTVIVVDVFDVQKNLRITVRTSYNCMTNRFLRFPHQVQYWLIAFAQLMHVLGIFNDDEIDNIHIELDKTKSENFNSSSCSSRITIHLLIESC